MTTASNRVFWATAVHRAVDRQVRVAALALAAWLLLTAIAVMLALRVLSVPGPPAEDPAVTPEPNSEKPSGLPALPRREPGAQLRALPRPAGEPDVQIQRRALPRPAREPGAHVRAIAPLIPRQAERAR
jgi:hypothetical protein